MSFSRVVPYGLCIVLLLSSFSTDARAGTSCTGTEKCDTTNTCGTATTCAVKLTRNGSSVYMYAQIAGNFQQVTFFCVASGATINWITNDDDAFVKFARGSTYPTPFPNGQTTVVVTSTTPASTTATYDDCYSFGVAACDVSATAGGGSACGTADPKVVVGGGGPMFHKGHARDRDNDKDKD